MSNLSRKAVPFLVAAFFSMGAFADQLCGTISKIEAMNVKGAFQAPYKKVTIGDQVLTVDDTSGWHSVISNALISQVAICINYTSRVVAQDSNGTQTTAGIIDSITLSAR